MQLAPLEKLTAKYLLDGPQTNRIGLYFFVVQTAQADLGMSTSQFGKTFTSTIDKMNYEWNHAARVLYIPTWWKWNEPEGPNQFTGCLKDVYSVPKCGLVAKFLNNAKYLSKVLFKNILANVRQRFLERSPIQEQEQYQEQEQEQKNNYLLPLPPPLGAVKAAANPESGHSTQITARTANAKATAAALDYEESWAEEAWPSVRRFIAKYNRESPDAWSAVERLDDKRVAKVREYLGLFPDEEFWTTVYRNAKRSRWCSEYKGASMDWLLQVGRDGVRNCLKTYEGKYGKKNEYQSTGRL